MISNKTNINFTCIKAMEDACYAGTNAILTENNQFHVHDRHQGSILSFMQVKVMIENKDTKTLTLDCITDA